jgi:SPOR domain
VTEGSQVSQSGFDWEAAGKKLGTALDSVNALVVLGSDSDATARVALGIASQQSRKRQVAVGDLLGDAAPFQELVSSDDPHGLVDVFEYGVSLHLIARAVPGNANLILLPTGAFVTDTGAIMAHRRWSSLVANFRDENGLLIVAAHVAAPEVESFVVQLDGAVLVGDVAPERLPVSRVLGRIRAPERVSVVMSRPPVRERKHYVVRSSGPTLGMLGGMILTLLLLATGVWYGARPVAESSWAPMWLRDVARRIVPENPDSAALGAAIPDSVLALTRPQPLTGKDSAALAPFGITIVTFNTRDGALLELQRYGATLRAGTFTPVLIRESSWFRVVAGAYPDSAGASALLDTLRARSIDAGRTAMVERYPYALLIERDVADSSVASRLSLFRARGLPVYALLQPDGTSRIYAGAFKSPDEVTMLADALRAAGVSPLLAYRTGRVF